MLLLEVIKQIKFWKEVSKLKTENLKRETSQILDASVSVFKNTLIWVLSMILSLVSSVWTFMLSLKDQEAELPLEEDAKAESELNIELANKTLCNGLKRNMMEPSTIDLCKIFKLNSLIMHK